MPLEKAEPKKRRKGKGPMQEKNLIEFLQEQLREAREEVIEAKLDRKELMEKVSKLIDYYDEVVEKARRMVKRTLSLHMMLKHMYKRNKWLQAERSRFQKQVKGLET